MIKTIRPGPLCMAAGLFLAGAVPGGFAAGGSFPQAEALRGAPAFRVAVHDNRQAGEGYLVVKSLEEALVQRLKTAGIPVGWEAPGIIDAGVNGVPAGDGRHVIYTLDIAVQIRGVTLGRLGEAVHVGDKVTVLPNEKYLDLIDGAQWVTVWGMSRLGLAEGPGLHDAITGDLEMLADRLIADYWRVNGAE